MKLFKMNNWELTLREEIWGLAPFKTLLDRDKTKDKEVANAEILFIWYYCDVQSDFLIIPEETREKEIIKQIPALPKNWKKDKAIDEAIEFYEKMSTTIIQYLYKQAIRAAQDTADYIGNARALLNLTDNAGRPIYKINDITKGLKDVSIIMKNLKQAEKEVIKEAKDNEGKSKGSQQFNTFEGGLSID